MPQLGLLFGALVGLSLGLTGGGGSILAVPLLVYGLGTPPRDAVTVSLAAVGLTALFGAVERWRQGQVEVRTGLLFAIAGMFGAPAGARLGALLSPAVLLGSFAVLMLAVAVRMWLQAGRPAPPGPEDESGPTCRRDPEGRLRLTSRCAALLTVVGLLTGVLSGLYGVGGGFVIVPALVMTTGLGIHRAIATSMLIMTLVSLSGLGSHLLQGATAPLDLVALFAVGGVGGMIVGGRIGRRLSGSVLQRIFAAAIVAVAVFMLLQQLR